MRNLITPLLAFVLICSLVSCSEQQEQTQHPGNMPNSSQPAGHEEMFEPTAQDAAADEWGLSMELLFKTATEFDLVFTHSSTAAAVHGTLTTSPEYEIRVLYQGEVLSFPDYMTNVLGKPYADATPTWNTVLYTLPADETFTIEEVLNVRDESGGLPLGEYVLCKPVTLTTKDGETIKKIFTAEFAVVEDVDTVQQNSDAAGTVTLELSGADADELMQIIENGEWTNDVTKTISDYKLILEDRTIYYSSQAGVFNEGKGSPFPVAGKSLRLTDEEQKKIHDLLEKYISN